MKRHNLTLPHFLFALVLNLALISFTAGQIARNPSSAEWHKLTSNEGGFSVKFPSKPSYKVASMNLANIEMPRYIYMLSISDTQYFEVDYVDFPAGSQGSRFDGAVAGMTRLLTSKGGQVTSRTAIRNSGCEGQEIIGTTPEMKFMQMRFFYSGRRFYALLYSSSSNTENYRDVAQYFVNSFEVVDGCKGEQTPAEAPSTEITTSFIEGTLDPVTGWRKIASVRDAFNVLMPSQVKVAEQGLQTTPFPISSRTYEASSGTAWYMIRVIGDFPEGMFKNRDSYQVVLDVLQKDMEKEFAGFNAKISLVRNTAIESYPGRGYIIATEKRTGQAKLFITPKRAYVILAFDDLDSHPSANFERFFGSISISIR